MSHLFSMNYLEARTHFLEACKSCGATIRSYPQERINDQTPIDLTVDTACIGPTNPDRTLVVISGTHGVEGFCGSACQIALVESEGWRHIPADTSVFLIHALNPYGFASLRRVDAENIDLNRNCVNDFSELADYNPEYDALNAALNPTRWLETDPQDGDHDIFNFINNYGTDKFREVVSIGQYRHPKGLFFGGRGKSWSRLVLENIVETEFHDSRSLCILDYHTGLA